MNSNQQQQQSRQQRLPIHVVSAGDSWAYGNAEGLKHKFLRHGYTQDKVRVFHEGLPGTTALYWEHRPHLIIEAVRRTRADFVLLSLGGNDFRDYNFKTGGVMPMSPYTVIGKIQTSVRGVLDTLFKHHPHVHVVMYGYDFPAFSGTHISGGNRFITALFSWMGVRTVNYIVMQYGKSLQTLANEFTKRGFSMTYVPLWGTLQHEADKAAAKAAAAASAVASKASIALDDDDIEADPEPIVYNLGMPSPTEMMHDPIHANQRGYYALMERLYHAYFKRHLAEAIAPQAAKQAQPQQQQSRTTSAAAKQQSPPSAQKTYRQ